MPNRVITELETMAQRGWKTSWTRVNTYLVESDSELEDPLNIVSAAAGLPDGTLPGRQAWKWNSGGGGGTELTDNDTKLESITVKLRSRAESRKIWLVTLTYTDYRGEKQEGRNRDSSKRTSYPQ